MEKIAVKLLQLKVEAFLKTCKKAINNNSAENLD